MRRLMSVALILAAFVVAACGAEPTPFQSPLVPSPSTFESPLGLPNPASKFCEEQGYELEMRQEAGGTVGYCLFPDGSECEEWAFYQGECSPSGGESGAGVPNPASKFCEDQGYRLEMREESGGTAGYCIFPDGSECEEWAFFRGECGPGTQQP